MTPGRRRLSWLAAVLLAGAAPWTWAQEPGGISRDTGLELLNRLQRLQEEVRELRGQLEVQTHELEQLRRRQRNLYSDLDRRLRELEVRGATPAPARPSAEASGRTDGEAAEAAGAPPAPAGGEGGDGAPTRTAAAAGPGEIRDRYREAFNLLKEARYDEAVTAFEDFLSRHPDSSYSDNAQYWLGESYYVTRRFDQAVAQFQKVLDEYPDSAKVPDAMLKIGYVRYEQQSWDDARAMLKSLHEQHPDTTAARLAEQRLQRIKLEGH